MVFHHGPATFHLLGEDRVGVANQEGEAGRAACDVEVSELPVPKAWSTLDAGTHERVVEAKRRLWRWN